jgi:hypothetical protein
MYKKREIQKISCEMTQRVAVLREKKRMKKSLFI